MNEKRYYRGYIELTRINETKAYRIVKKHFKGIFTKASRTYLDKPETPLDLLVNEADTLAMLTEIYEVVGIPMGLYVAHSLPKQKNASLVRQTKARKQYQQTPDQNDQINYWKQEFLRFTQSAHCAKKVSGVTKTTKEQIRSAIDQGVREQLSHKQVAKLILKKADAIDTKKRALLIARTEHAVGSNLAAIYAAKSSGLVLYKKWIARSGDTKTRDSHASMIGSQPIPMDQAFDVDGTKMMHPGDSSLGAKSNNICNCRCICGFIPASEVVQTGLTNAKPERKPRISKPKPLPQPNLFDKPIDVRDWFSYKPASTVAEATQYAIDQQFAKSVNFRWTKDVEVANQVNKTLFELKERFGLRTLEQMGDSPKSSRALMSANFRALSINHNIFKTMNTTVSAFRKYEVGYDAILKRNIDVLQSRPQTTLVRRQLAEMAEQQKYKRFTVHYAEETYIEDTIIHEYAHMMNDQLTGAINGRMAINKKMLGADGRLNDLAVDLNKEAYRTYIKAKSNGDIYKVSYYGSTNKEEFFAETFLMYYKKDPDLPTYIVEFFDKYFTLTK